MTLSAKALFLALAIFGHLGLWNGLTNRLHGTGLGRWKMKAITQVLRTILVLGPLAYVWLWLWHGAPGPLDFRPDSESLVVSADEGRLLVAYGALCSATAVVFYPLWWRDFRRKRPQFLDSRRIVIDMYDDLGVRPVAGVWAGAWSRLPGNQFLAPEAVEHRLEVPRLPRALDGLTVVHLTDLHLSGRVTLPYYRRAMRQVAEWEPDLVIITGDLCEHARNIPGIAEIVDLAPAREGKFYLLGNHDLRTKNVPALRAALAAVGCEDLGGAWRELSIRGTRVLLGGDQRPWFSPPLDPTLAGPRAPGAAELRIVGLHSPDRVSVARAADADLALAGHTHGGQIRLPVIGAIVCPSLFGLRYNAGLYDESPTLLYVTRGLCSLTPVRLNCRPELARFELRCPPERAAT